MGHNGLSIRIIYSITFTCRQRQTFLNISNYNRVHLVKDGLYILCGDMLNRCCHILKRGTGNILVNGGTEKRVARSTIYQRASHELANSEELAILLEQSRCAYASNGRPSVQGLYIHF